MRTPAELITARDRVAKVLIKAGIALRLLIRARSR